jgi:hypothetical protein
MDMAVSSMHRKRLEDRADFRFITLGITQPDRFNFVDCVCAVKLNIGSRSNGVKLELWSGSKRVCPRLLHLAKSHASVRSVTIEPFTVINF